MYLVSLSEQTVTLGGEVFSFQKDETIHTENSYKYSPDEFRALAARAGYKTTMTWIDINSLFGIYFLQSQT